MGKFTDGLRNALRDQAVGIMKNGASTSPAHNARVMREARLEREAREAAALHRSGPYDVTKKKWYSTNRGGDAEYFIGPDGEFTNKRPHIHVTHHDSSPIDFVVTKADGSHVYRTTLPGTATGDEVNAMIRSLLSRL